MKFKSASFSNRKRELHIVYVSGKKAVVHYGSIGITDPIKRIQVDKETSGRSLKIEFANGKADYMPYDQPLFLIRDPEYMLRDHIENVVARINEEIDRKKISKKYLARQLKTSDNQVQRLLNPRIMNKNLTQLYKLAALVGLEFEVSVKAA